MLTGGLAILSPKAIGNPSLHEGLLCIEVPTPSGLSKKEMAELRRFGWSRAHEDDMHWWEFRIEER